MRWPGLMRLRSRLMGSWMLLILCVAAFLLALLMPLHALGLTAEEARLQQAFTRGQIIRLHILAEDDSPEAQQTKLAVRDALLAAFGQEMAQAGAQDAETVYALLMDRQGAMQRIAEETARAHGFDGPVTAQVGLMTLPEKAYGAVTLPAGEYRALRITLGKGEGQNWWCVLFPQLCLALASEEPWQAMPVQPEQPIKVEWKSREILRHWLLQPIEETMEKETAKP